MKTIRKATFTVVKTDIAANRKRLYDQYRWLLVRRQRDGIVHVDRWREDAATCGYEMEYLYRYPVESRARTIGIITGILANDVWCYPAEVTPDIAFDPPLSWPEAVSSWWNEIEGSGSVYADCATHGDPTIENLMMRADGTPVLVDPIPDAVTNRRVPSIRALDYGKLIQSAFGYEDVKANRAFRFSVDELAIQMIRRSCGSAAEWKRSCALALLHFYRLIPYQDDSDQRRWRSWMPEIAVRLLSISTVY